MPTKTLDEVRDMDLERKNVLIIGSPASGKTYLANSLKTGHKVIHTDDYMSHGYEQSMYAVLDDIKASDKPTLVEGVQGYRLLRKGVQTNSYYPDVVIELAIPANQMMDIYRKERDPKKIKYLQGFNKTHQKILDDYRALPNTKPPTWIKVFNVR